MRAAHAAAVILAVVACHPARAQSASRYVMTAAPIDVGVTTRGLCIAVDPGTATGVWWWEPGRTGCSTRSTGPTIFDADTPSVTRGAAPGTWTIHFRLPLITGPTSSGPGFADVSLALHDDDLASLTSGARVRMEPRRTLDIPERP